MPRLSGNPRLRQTLSCTRGDWDDEATDRYAVAYRWLRDGVEIAGATQSTYTTVRADVQTNIACRVRAEDLTNATSASLTSAARTTWSRPPSPATRGCSARCPAPAATGTTSPPTATR